MVDSCMSLYRMPPLHPLACDASSTAPCRCSQLPTLRPYHPRSTHEASRRPQRDRSRMSVPVTRQSLCQAQCCVRNRCAGPQSKPRNKRCAIPVHHRFQNEARSVLPGWAPLWRHTDAHVCPNLYLAPIILASVTCCLGHASFPWHSRDCQIHLLPHKPNSLLCGTPSGSINVR